MSILAFVSLSAQKNTILKEINHAQGSAIVRLPSRKYLFYNVIKIIYFSRKINWNFNLFNCWYNDILFSFDKLVFIAPALYKIICFLYIFKAIVFHDTHYYIVLISYLIFNAWFKTIKQLHADEQLTIYKKL